MSTVLRDPQRVHTYESVSIRAQRILGEAFMTLWDDPAVREQAPRSAQGAGPARPRRPAC